MPFALDVQLHAPFGDRLGRCLTMFATHLTCSDSASYTGADKDARRAHRELEDLLRRASSEIKKQARQAQKSRPKAATDKDK
jgi:hypothetical protein